MGLSLPAFLPGLASRRLPAHPPPIVPVNRRPFWSFVLLWALLSPPAQARRDRPDDRTDRVSKPSKAPSQAEHPGRLLNQAQQELARGEVDAALSSLRRSLEGAPEDGYAWTLLADTLCWGLGQCDETKAAWKDLAERSPDRPLLRIWAVRAEQSTHRGDKFTGGDSPWIQDARKTLDGLVLESHPLAVRYAALIARRDLRYAAGDRDGALDDGVAAWTLDPAPLQGRISRLQRAVKDRDLPQVRGLALQLLETDPWAAEACSTVWDAGTWPDPAAIATVREELIAAVTKLEDRGVKDPVVGNELLKFWKRIRDTGHQQDLAERISKKHKGWKLLESDDWWKGVPFSVDPKVQPLFAETNRTYTITDPAQRLAALLALLPKVPEKSANPVVVRYHQAVIAACRAVDPPDRANRAVAIKALLAATPDDPLPWFEQATLGFEEQKDLPGALEAVRSSIRLLLARPHELRTTNGPVDFDWSQQRLGEELAQRRALEAKILDLMGRKDESWNGAREAALLGDSATNWQVLATKAADRHDFALAREADLSAYGRAGKKLEELPAEYRQQAASRYAEAHPEVGLLGADPESALVAAARVRGEAAQKAAPTPSGKAKEVHPLVGQPAPALSVKTLDGKDVSLASLRGQVVVVDFWATWCGPCKAEMPELEQIKGHLAGKPVTFLMLSIDEDAALVPKFVEDSKYSFTIAHIGNGPIKSQWRVKGIPSLFILDGQGVVRHHQQGFRAGLGDGIEAKIRGLLP